MKKTFKFILITPLFIPIIAISCGTKTTDKKTSFVYSWPKQISNKKIWEAIGGNYTTDYLKAKDYIPEHLPSSVKISDNVKKPLDENAFIIIDGIRYNAKKNHEIPKWKIGIGNNYYNNVDMAITKAKQVEKGNFHNFNTPNLVTKKNVFWDPQNITGNTININGVDVYANEKLFKVDSSGSSYQFQNKFFTNRDKVFELMSNKLTKHNTFFHQDTIILNDKETKTKIGFDFIGTNAIKSKQYGEDDSKYRESTFLDSSKKGYYVIKESTLAPGTKELTPLMDYIISQFNSFEHRKTSKGNGDVFFNLKHSNQNLHFNNQLFLFNNIQNDNQFELSINKKDSRQKSLKIINEFFTRKEQEKVIEVFLKDIFQKDEKITLITAENLKRMNVDNFILNELLTNVLWEGVFKKTNIKTTKQSSKYHEDALLKFHDKYYSSLNNIGIKIVNEILHKDNLDFYIDGINAKDSSFSQKISVTYFWKNKGIQYQFYSNFYTSKEASLRRYETNSLPNSKTINEKIFLNNLPIEIYTWDKPINFDSLTFYALKQEIDGSFRNFVTNPKKANNYIKAQIPESFPLPTPNYVGQMIIIDGKNYEVKKVST